MMPCKFCGKYYGLFVWPRCERGHWHRYRDDTLESRTDLGLRAVATRHTMKGTCELLARTNPRQCATSAGRWLHLCYSTHRWHATDRPMSAWGRHSPRSFSHPTPDAGAKSRQSKEMEKGGWEKQQPAHKCWVALSPGSPEAWT